jgi:hypothetical protein
MCGLARMSHRFVFVINELDEILLCLEWVLLSRDTELQILAYIQGRSKNSSTDKVVACGTTPLLVAMCFLFLSVDIKFFATERLGDVPLTRPKTWLMIHHVILVLASTVSLRITRKTGSKRTLFLHKETNIQNCCTTVHGHDKVNFVFPFSPCVVGCRICASTASYHLESVVYRYQSTGCTNHGHLLNH